MLECRGLPTTGFYFHLTSQTQRAQWCIVPPLASNWMEVHQSIHPAATWQLPVQGTGAAGSSSRGMLGTSLWYVWEWMATRAVAAVFILPSWQRSHYSLAFELGWCKRPRHYAKPSTIRFIKKAACLESVTKNRGEIATNFVGSQQVRGLKEWASS